MKKSEEERKKEVEKIARHIHPHDDEPDPTAYMGNYNFPQMLFVSAWIRYYVCIVGQRNQRI